MKYTNKKNLSPLMAGMIERSMERYNPGDSDYSTTTLIDAPRIVNLKRKHKDELETDVSDLIAAFVGNAIHEHLEGLAPEGSLPEKRLFAEVDGLKISGCIDIFEFKKFYKRVLGIKDIFVPCYVVGDYKTIKVWVIIHGDIYEKWEQQLNINAWLAKQNGIEVEETAFIEYFIMDWQQGIAENNKSYPQQQQNRWEIKLWPEEKQLEFIKERIRLHEDAKIKLPLCSNKERWKKDDTYKLMRKGRKTSLKNEAKQLDLIEWATKKGHIKNGKIANPFSIDFFPGEFTRCLKYCNASKFCEQWNKDNV